MIAQIVGAVTRGALVALMIATPSLLAGGVSADTAHAVTLIALFAGGFVCLEYASAFPSLLEFRHAPPYNRLLFVALMVLLFILSAMARDGADATALTGLLKTLGGLVGYATDLAYSPVRLVLNLLPAGAGPDLTNSVRAAAGLSYVLSLATVAALWLLTRLSDWPKNGGVFNVWINLPLFDPTSGGDVVPRLQRDARFNVAVGFLLPFLLPALLKSMAYYVGHINFADSQALIWTMAVWAFAPAALMMRGIAMLRIADLIQEKRRRTGVAEAAIAA